MSPNVRSRGCWPSCLCLVAAAAVLGPACSGAIDAAPGGGHRDVGAPAPNEAIGSKRDPSKPPAGAGAAPAAPGPAIAGHLPAPKAASFIRRLSNRELGNAIEALLGFRPEALSRLPADSQSLLFDRVREAQTVSNLHVGGFEALADELATRLLSGTLGTLVSACGSDRARWSRRCAEAFLEAVQERAFRRPVHADERAAALRLFDAGQSFDEGFRLLVHRLFRSPHFLYLVERGAPGDAAERPRPLSDFELAARLSFSLCETVPDAALWTDAKAGALVATPDKVTAHARRLLEGPCGRASVRRFFAQWLRLEEVPHLTRNKTLFPSFDASVAAAMQAETERFLERVVFEEGGTVANLLDARFSVLDDKTAAIYGLGASGREAKRRELPPERRGLLTQPSLLAVTSDDNASSPVLRGLFVLDRVLCGELPPPPPDLEIAVPDLDSSRTTRQRWERHSADPVCSVCHKLIDPVGFALEDFDALGRHRTEENGKPIDASGGVPLFGVPAGSIRGGAELATAIAGLPQLGHCFARRWTRFALGRLEAETDRALIDELAALAGKGAPVRDVLAALGTTAAFAPRAPSAGATTTK